MYRSQGDISKAYSAGYTKVMENYSDSSINEAGRQSIFAQEYLKSLREVLSLTIPVCTIKLKT